MQNLDPDTMKTAFEKFNNMSKEDLEKFSKESGMNFTPEMLQQAMGFMKNMSPEQLNDVVKNASASNQNSVPLSQPNVPKTEGAPSGLHYEEIHALKKQGNAKYQEAKSNKANEASYEVAITHYLEALIAVEDAKDAQPTEPQKEELRKLEVDCRNNLATVKAMQDDFHSVIIHSEAALILDKKNVKSLYRLGQGYQKMKRFEKAYNYSKEALELQPNNEDYKKLYESCKEEYEQYKKDNKNDDDNNQENN